MSFWKKHHDTDKGIVVHYCEKHEFRAHDPLEIEEHERQHALEESGLHL